MDDLFSEQGNDKAPLAERVRPRSIEEVIGHGELITDGSPLMNVLTGESSISSVLLFGPPGCGKTTLAKLAAKGVGEFVELSATSNGVGDVRGVVERGKVNRDLHRKRTVLFIDEIHRFSKSQQDSLLHAVERGYITLLAASTENPYFSVISPLLSRSLIITLSVLSDLEINQVIDRALVSERGLAGEFDLAEEARVLITRSAQGDARKALVVLEAASEWARGIKSKVITDEYVLGVVSGSVPVYDKNGDQHYDVLSAFIKSMRGGDADAVLHYLGRMLVSGEDPVLIARRIIISAAEDVGLANTDALVVASAALESVKSIGMPEGRIILAEAALVVTLSKKSNSVVKGIDEAMVDVRYGVSGKVPVHLRDNHYKGANELGNGLGYVYPHDQLEYYTPQRYIPLGLDEKRYYKPKESDGEYGSFWVRTREKLRGLKSKKEEA
ncbi:MAG: replication-associated recombination protein A [Candidatus Paceibacterota bacterium]